MTQGLVAAPHILLKGLGRFRDAVFSQKNGVFRQVIKKRRQFVKKQRQVVLHAIRCDVAAHVLIHTALPNIDLKFVVPAVAKPGDCRIIKWKLFGGQQAHAFNPIHGALRIRVEGAQGIDFIVQQVDTHGQGGTHGVDVHQGTADGVLPPLGYGLYALVSRRL